MMASPGRHTRSHSWPSACVALGAVLLLLPLSSAAQHRARVAGSLASALAAGAPGNAEAIITAPQEEVDWLARTYGVRVVKRLDMGALLWGSAAALDAVANDENVAALAANEVVMSTMSVTTQSTGANQLWADDKGRRHFGGITGARVGVAVLDSGVANHPDRRRG